MDSSPAQPHTRPLGSIAARPPVVPAAPGSLRHRSAATNPDVAPEHEVLLAPDPGSDHGGPGPESSLQLQIARPGRRVTVISVGGEIDLATRGQFERGVLETVAASPGHVVVLELNRVTFLGTGEIHTLLAADDHARRGGGAVALVLDQISPAARSLHVAGLDTFFTTHSTLTAALDLPPAAAGRRSPHVDGHEPRDGAGPRSVQD